MVAARLPSEGSQLQSGGARFNQAGGGSAQSEVEGADSAQSQRCSRLERSFGCEAQAVKVLQAVKG